MMDMGRDEIHRLDLVDMTNLVNYNKGFWYLLTRIGVFSKYAWMIPLKNKTGKTLVCAFKTNVESSGRPPVIIHTDKGSESTKRQFQDMLKTEKIHFYTTNSGVKASIVERFNRSFKSRMWRYFTWKTLWGTLTSCSNWWRLTTFTVPFKGDPRQWWEWKRSLEASAFIAQTTRYVSV